MDNFLNFLKKYWWLALFFVLFPYFIAFIFFFPSIPPDLGLSYKEWLNFWGVFIGSAIGGLTALYAVYSSLKQNEMFHIDQENFQKEQVRMRKCEALPVLEIRENNIFREKLSNRKNIHSLVMVLPNETNDFSFYQDFIQADQFGKIHVQHKDNEITFYVDFSLRSHNGVIKTCFYELINKSYGPASHISLEPSGIAEQKKTTNIFLSKDSNFSILFVFPEVFSVDKIVIFNLTFKNIFEEEYFQELVFHINNNEVSLEQKYPKSKP